MFDIDTYNQINREEKEYSQWEKEQKNKILSSSLSGNKKQSLWKSLFPKPIYSVEIENMVW